LKSRSLVALMLASILGLLPLSTVWAIVQVTQLRMSTTGDGPATAEFPTGTQEVFVNFEYSNANNEQIKIEITDNEIGVAVWVRSETYTGSGKKNLSINGQMMMDGYKSAASTRNSQLMDQINLAKNNTNPSMAQAQLPPAIAIARDLRGIALALRRDPSAANGAAQLDQAINLLAQTISKGTQLIDNQQTPADQLIGRIGSELFPLAQSAVDSLNAALPGISSEPGRALPGGSYLTSIKVGSTASSAAYVEWTVALAATPTPALTSTPAASSFSQATATPASGGQAASITPRPIQSPATSLPTLTAQPTPQRTTVPLATPLSRVTPTGGPSPATKALASTATVTPPATVATGLSPTPGLTASPTQKAGTPPSTGVASAKDSSGLGTGIVVVVAALLLGIVALWVRKRV